MKNVRLFAVAAAMGMFASTVCAAENVTKDSYIATWGEVDEIVKVDVGDKVVAPTATIKVVKETRTTDVEKATENQGTTFGQGNGLVCYKGFTNETAKDTDGDGFEDYEIKVLYDGAIGAGWYYTQAKFWPTTKTAMMYVGYKGGSIYGARFLEPGSAEVKNMFHYIPDHKDMATVADVIAWLEAAGTITKVDTDADGYNDTYKVNEVSYSVKEGTNKGKKLGSIWTTYTVPEVRNGETLLDEAIVSASLSKGWKDADGKDVDPDVKYFYTTTTATATDIVPAYYVGETEVTGKIVALTENRYGELIAEVLDETTIAADDMDSNVELKANDEKVTVVTVLKNGKYSVYGSFSPKAQKAWTTVQYYAWDEVDGTFYAHDVVTETDDVAAVAAEFGGEYSTSIAKAGLVHYTAEANTSDKYVLNTHGTGLTTAVKVTGINTTKGTMTIEGANGTEYTVSAVKLADNKWYPAVDTAEEMEKLFELVAGLHTPNAKDEETDTWKVDMSDVTAALTAAKAYSTRSYLDGTKDEKYIPESPLGHYKGVQCTYKVAEAGEATAVITSNADAIDTTTSGIKTLTLTAKVGEEVVGTKEVKVVVAPKYERVYKNGKVVKLTAKWLNGNTYAVYNYDWAAKTYTATFYAQDGVTVASTANGTL